MIPPSGKACLGWWAFFFWSSKQSRDFLPQKEIALALLMFNVGVELGQLLFIAAILVLLMALRKVRSEWPAWAYQIPAYGIGSIAAFWFINRVAGF